MKSKNSIAKASQGNRAVLWFLLGSCLFFSIYDIIVEKLWWTTLSIYLPCTLVFSFGIYAWRRLNVSYLLILGLILIAVDLFLIGYGASLWGDGEALWGPLTLGFASITLWMTYSVWSTRRALL